MATLCSSNWQIGKLANWQIGNLATWLIGSGSALLLLRSADAAKEKQYWLSTRPGRAPRCQYLTTRQHSTNHIRLKVKVSQERMWKCVYRLKMIWLDDINTWRLINILRVSYSIILSSKSSHDHHCYDHWSDQPIWTMMFMRLTCVFLFRPDPSWMIMIDFWNLSIKYIYETLPKALRTQVLTASTSSFDLVGSVVCLVE